MRVKERMTYNEKIKVAEEFIATVNPYEKSTNLNFDLRGYAKYVKEHNYAGKNIPVDVINKFSK